jgi:hypothetical protein
VAIELIVGVLERGPKRATDRFVLLVIVQHAIEISYRNYKCNPGVRRICEHTQLTERTVIAAIARNEKAGFFTRVRHGKEKWFQVDLNKIFGPEEADWPKSKFTPPKGEPGSPEAR